MRSISIGENAIYPNVGIRVEEGYEGIVMWISTTINLSNNTPFTLTESLFFKESPDISKLQNAIATLQEKAIKDHCQHKEQ